MILKIVLIFLLGIFVGMVINNLIKPFVGTLLIDQNSSDKEIYRLEIKDLESLSTKKRILLKVNSHANLSQK